MHEMLQRCRTQFLQPSCCAAFTCSISSSAASFSSSTPMLSVCNPLRSFSHTGPIPSPDCFKRMQIENGGNVVFGYNTAVLWPMLFSEACFLLFD